MMKNGLLEEARQTLEKEGLTSKQAIGHKELKPYFKGEISIEEAVENIKRATRRYAKRQLSWFRKNEKTVRLYADSDDKNALYAKAIDLCRKFLEQ